MPLTPQITLSVDLKDFSGVEIGSLANPAYVRVALCGFGQSLPRIPGTAIIGKVASWPGDIPYTGAPLTGGTAIKLWGNDVISPAGTYYMIAVLDASKNVIQSGIYQFTGTQTIDLSNAPQIVQPSPQLAGMQLFELIAGAPGSSVNLPATPIPGTPVLVFRSGILLSAAAGDYSISGTTVTINYGAGDVIKVLFWTSTF